MLEALDQVAVSGLHAEARKEFTHPIACIDCHVPDTMALRVTRPGFIEGIRAVKAG